MGISGYFPYVIVGRLRRDYILFKDGSEQSDIPGGELLYTAAGMNSWEKHPALVSRAGINFPTEWLSRMQQTGFDTDGIRTLPIPLEHRRFFSCLPHGDDEPEWNRSSFLSEDVRAGIPVPHSLLGMVQKPFAEDSKTLRTDETIIYRDIPAAYLEARCIHFCPHDFLTHNLLPQHFQNREKKTITIQTGAGYMIPHFLEEMKHMLLGITALITTEEELRTLFSEKVQIADIHEMMKRFQQWGCENIVVQRRDRSLHLLSGDHGEFYTLPPYMEEIPNPIGELPAFCGGFLTGLNETYDPMQAFVRGASAASFAVECLNPFDLPGGILGLQNARMDILNAKLEKSI